MSAAPDPKPSAAAPKPRHALPKALIVFWAGFAAIALGGIGILQYLGPPHQAAPMVANIPPAAAPAVQTAAPLSAPPVAPPAMAQMGTGSRLAPGAPIPPPMLGLLAPSASNPNWLVPRIGPAGMAPMQAYAAGAAARPGPLVAVLVAGLGDDDAQSQAAVSGLPAAISFAMTPYGKHLADIAALARAAGHETLLAIAMQEADPATQNAGDEALVMAGPITLDQPMLDWNLAQLEGYAGVTDAIGATQGAGFMNNPNAKAWLLQEIADKGLFFIDARQTGAAPYAWNRTADVVIDPVRAPEQETAQLAQLAADARLQGNALAILLNPAPIAVQTLAAWTQTLAAQGITLVPVSALVLPPANATAPVASASAASVNP